MEAALSAALACGLDAAGFFGATPYLTGLHVRAALAARRDAALFAAWHAEALARTPRLPSLEDLLADAAPEAAADAWAHGWAHDWAHGWAHDWGLAFTPVDAAG